MYSYRLITLYLQVSDSTLTGELLHKVNDLFTLNCSLQLTCCTSSVTFTGEMTLHTADRLKEAAGYIYIYAPH